MPHHQLKRDAEERLDMGVRALRAVSALLVPTVCGPGDQEMLATREEMSALLDLLGDHFSMLEPDLMNCRRAERPRQSAHPGENP